MTIQELGDHPDTASESLFSYGTLQLESVQLTTFGRRLTGHADQLPGYRLDLLEIRDAVVVATSGQTHHPILVRTEDVPGNFVEGTVFSSLRRNCSRPICTRWLSTDAPA